LQSGEIEGHITGYSFGYRTQAFLTITGLNLDATEVFNLIGTRDLNGLMAAYFAGDDVFNAQNFQSAYGGGQIIDAYSGNDVVYGSSSNDLIRGGSGQDSLYGGTGMDSLHGGTEDDLLLGDAGNDMLFGDDGNDVLYGGWDDDTLSGGLGSDTVAFSGASTGYTATPGAGGALIVTGADGKDTLNNIEFLKFSDTTISLATTYSAATTTAWLAEGTNAGNTPFLFTVTRSVETSFAAVIAWTVTGSGANPADSADFLGGVRPSGTLSFAAGRPARRSRSKRHPTASSNRTKASRSRCRAWARAWAPPAEPS